MYNNLRIFKDTLRFDTNDLTYMPYIGNLSRYKMGGMVGGISLCVNYLNLDLDRISYEYITKYLCEKKIKMPTRLFNSPLQNKKRPTRNSLRIFMFFG